MANVKRIRTVLYGDQRLSSAELEILHTPAMQRLYGLKQLGLTDRVFIDASHSRLHHVVGVLEQVDKLVSAIVKNLQRSSKTFDIGSTPENHLSFSARQLARIVSDRKSVIRLVGLLHDLTHAPFGHTVEDEIGLVDSKHDEPSRQADAFYRLICQLIAWVSLEAKGIEFDSFPKGLRPFLSQGAHAELPNPSEVGHLAKRLLSDTGNSMGAYWRLSSEDFAQLLAQLNCAMTALLHLEALHNPELRERNLPQKGAYLFQSAIRSALQGTVFEKLITQFDFQPRRDAFMLDIVGNTVCADLLDYAKRDSHFSGLRLDYDTDRIAENFTLVVHDEPLYERNYWDEEDGDGPKGDKEIPEGKVDPFAGRCLRTAISLVSHKYRTDIPSELMNLLNVRFYLYERVIYHPTKCAGGSMLGTALQLLGWRSSGIKGSKPDLPPHLRFVGDEVFLHDIRAALDFILDWTAGLAEDIHIEREHISNLGNLDRVHSGLVSKLLDLRLGQPIVEVRRELLAARLLLDRLAARRYFRPVFRVSPSSAATEELAKEFKKPNVRYDAERRIEGESGLPLGTVTIHCPTRTTAKKIANVLLTSPKPTGGEAIFKLKHINQLDDRTFKEHKKAVRAVERMYGSMWRFVVYVAPEHLSRYKEIADVVRRVISSTLDPLAASVKDQTTLWENDPHLVVELEAKLAPKDKERFFDESKLDSVATLVAELSKRVLESGQINDISPELFGRVDDLPPKLKIRLEEAISVLLRAKVSRNGEVDPAHRADLLLRVFKTYAKSIRREHVDHFVEVYPAALNMLSPGTFDEIVSTLEAKIFETVELEKRGGKHAHSGYKFNELQDELNYQLRIHSVLPPSKSRSVSSL